jgi:hypothetical protein
MTMSETHHLELPLLAAEQAQKHVTVNEALLALDAIVQLSALNRHLTAPPGSPAEGDRHIVGSGATGAWAGKDLKIALRLDGGWTFIAPRTGWCCWVEDVAELLVWKGSTSAWVNVSTASGMLGINGTASTTNRLTVKSDAALFSHDDVTPGTGNMQAVINKSAAAKDAGLVFQDGYSTRALFGLLANDDFTVKVSPDGSSFFAGLVVDKDNGLVTTPQKPMFSARGGTLGSIPAGPYAKVPFATASINVGGFFNGTLNRWTPPEGTYDVGAYVHIAGVEANTRVAISLRLNGSTVLSEMWLGSGNNLNQTVMTRTIVALNGTDYIEVFAKAEGTTSKTFYLSQPLGEFFGQRIS